MVWLILVLICAYLLGSIPFGFLMVRLFTGEDVRQMGSGRTGGTNTWRVAGRLPGVLTTVLDGTKAAVSVWLAQAVVPGELRSWGMALAGVNVADWATQIGVAADGKAIMLKYGAFLQTVIDFVIVAFIIFMALRGINRLKKPAPTAAPAAPPAQEVLLTQIRDLLA